MARLGHCRGKQHHHLCHRDANGGIRIRSRQSFLHRALCKQLVALATESPDREFSISPAVPSLVVSAFRAWPKLCLRCTDIRNKHFYGLLWIPPDTQPHRNVRIWPIRLKATLRYSTRTYRELDWAVTTIRLRRDQSYRLPLAHLRHSRADDRNHPRRVAMRVTDVGDHLIEVGHGGFTRDRC